MIYYFPKSRMEGLFRKIFSDYPPKIVFEVNRKTVHCYILFIRLVEKKQVHLLARKFLAFLFGGTLFESIKGF